MVFPPSSNTNAGRLNYQLQDAEKHKPRSDETWAVQLRPQKALYFPDGTKIPSSQSLRSESQSNSGFRPSPEYSVAVLNDDPIKGKRENPTLSNLSKESGVTKYFHCDPYLIFLPNYLPYLHLVNVTKRYQKRQVLSSLTSFHLLKRLT